MPWDHVMGKFRGGHLHSGSKSGPEVTNPKQAVAIMYSEKKAADAGNTEYQSGSQDDSAPKPSSSKSKRNLALQGLKNAGQ